MEERNKINYEGALTIGNLEIPCYVLEDGTRVLSGRGMQESLKMVDEENKHTSGKRLDRYLNQKTLQPYLYNGKEADHYNPIICYKGDAKINGYEATALVDICEAFLEARRNVQLSPRQAIIADQCEILVRGFARVGIIALVDEATGYQSKREKLELQKVLNAYISNEIAKWQLTFTDKFYYQIYRLWNLSSSYKSKNKPQFIGNLTNTYVYQQLPEGVLEALKEKNKKNESGRYTNKLHQSLTPEIGREHLKEQINRITTLMEISKNKDEFKLLFKKHYSNEPHQIMLDEVNN